jgi:hypothetical protein
MTFSKLKHPLFIGIAISMIAFDVPKNWFTAGSEPNSYEMGIEKGAGIDGSNAATIKSTKKKIKGFGTLMQNCEADIYLGKRVKMTGLVRSENVKNWAGLWMRVDQAGSRKSLSFDNMQDRPIKGTTDWKHYEIVLDVPANASRLAYGALLGGTGQIWFDNITFQIVDKLTPTTGSRNDGKSANVEEPANLDFEE